MKPILAALLLLPGPLLSGCIATEIRDEMRSANTNLAETNMRLSAVQDGLARTDVQLSAVQDGLILTNAQLANVQDALKRADERIIAANRLLETTNPKLTDLDGGLSRMRVIDDVSASLKEVQKELNQLIKSLGTVSSAASFLGLAGDGDVLASVDAAAAPSGAAGAPGSTQPTAAAAPGAAAPASTDKRADALAGTWVVVYPPPPPPQRAGRIVVIGTDGSYLEAEEGKPLLSGQWKRTGRTVTIRSGAAGAAQREESGELVAASPHALTIRFGDALRVYARP